MSNYKLHLQSAFIALTLVYSTRATMTAHGPFEPLLCRALGHSNMHLCYKPNLSAIKSYFTTMQYIINIMEMIICILYTS
jgi:hypothetical protein